MPSPHSPLKNELRLLRQHYNSFNEIATRLLRKMESALDADGHHKRPKVLLIQEIVCQHYAMPISIMCSKLKPARFVEPRQVAIYLARELTNYSQHDVGDCFGRDHGTVIYGCNAVAERIATEPLFANQIATLREVCQNRLKDLDLPLFATKQIQSA